MILCDNEEAAHKAAQACAIFDLTDTYAVIEQCGQWYVIGDAEGSWEYMLGASWEKIMTVHKVYGTGVDKHGKTPWKKPFRKP